MPPIAVSARQGDPAETAADTRVVPVFEGEELADAALQRLVESGEAKPGARKVAVAHEEAGDGARRVLLVGLGKREELDGERARVAAAAAAARARELGARALSWATPSANEETAAISAAIVEGTLLGLYEFDRCKSVPAEDEERARIESLEVVADGDVIEATAHARVRAEAQNAARDLQNLPSNVKTPEFLAERARELAGAHHGLEAEVHDRAWIESKGLGALAGVARGSETEPRLIVMRYSGGADAAGPHLGFVGKAVTFDSGGISIKPSQKMHEMKFDMSGGAAVIEAVGAIAELALPVRITAVVPATENMPSGSAIKPGDIVTALNGKTIEVNNTDAEGRLILADALAYAIELGAERIVDLATLTGAVITALGNTHCGLFSNDGDWCEQVEGAGRATGEIGWRLPLHPETAELMKGRYADLQNIPEAPKAGSITGAEFLRHFTADKPWVHMDIAGVAWGMARNYVGNGASGFGVRTLIELAERVSQEESEAGSE